MSAKDVPPAEIGPHAYIVAQGSYHPSKCLTNAEMEKVVDTSDEWITTRTGIKQRYIAAEGEDVCCMASEAVKILLAKADANATPVNTGAIDYVICATMTPDHIGSSVAVRVQQKLGLKGAAFDISAACSGYIYALQLAKALLKSSLARSVLVIGAEKFSSFLDYTDRSTCVLFGDGASCSLVSSQEHLHEIFDSSSALPPLWRISFSSLYSDGKYYDALYIPGGGSQAPCRVDTIQSSTPYIQMRGQEIYKEAILAMASVSEEILRRAGLSIDQLDYFVPHQANSRIIESVARRLGLDMQKCALTVQQYGNTSAASIGQAFAPIFLKGNRGDKALLVCFGAGLTWGGMLLECRGTSIE